MTSARIQSWFTALLASVAFASLAFGSPVRPLAVSSPCEPSERWDLGETIPADARAELAAFLAGRSSPARSLSEALSYRRDTASGDGRAFSEYWIARTLLSAGMPHAAQAGFAAIAMRKHEPSESPTIALAAIRCMSGLVRQHPALALPDGLGPRISEQLAAADGGRERQALWGAAALLLQQQIERSRPRDEIRATVALLRGAGAYEALGLGLWAALSDDQPGTAAEMERFISAENGVASRVPELEQHLDQAHLLAARAYYALGKYEPATRHLKLVRKSSNDLPESLSELAWSALSARDYGEAIGAALSLQGGGLRRVFAPEGPMVLAMALNELCQYPESLRAVDQFRKAYEPSYRWLSEWQRKPRGAEEDLYPLAVAYLRKRKIDAPDRVASEWVRSPWFISSQDELNLLVDESSSTARMSRAGREQQKAMGRDIRRLAHELLSRARAERARGLSPTLREELQRLLAQIEHYRRFRAAGPVWHALAAAQEASSPALRRAALDRVAHDLGARSRRMLAKLEEIAENNRMIEIEIYDGASQDIIWQNAHPDYQQLVKNLRDEARAARASKVWDWGRAPIGSDAWTEIWEDELGSFKSNLYDNCSNKEKYLAIKRGGVPKA